MQDTELLRAALVGYQHQASVLTNRIEEIKQQLGSQTSDRAPKPGTDTTKRQVSAAGRRRMADAQKRRWAAFHEQSGSPAKKAPGKGKGRRKMSAAGRERIAEATRKRWAAYRAQKGASK